MNRIGQYIYCIIPTTQESNFGAIGIDGEEVLTIGHDNLAMVVSSHPMDKLVVNKENMLIHEKVIERVMTDYDSVLPVRYGTIASTADEVRNLLGRRSREFESTLSEMDHMVELGVKGLWNNMDVIYKEIEQDNIDIKTEKEKIQSLDSAAKEVKVEIGKKVEAALIQKKEDEAYEIADKLRRLAYEVKLNKTTVDEMFMNASFLVGRGREKEFDNVMDDLSDEYKDRIKFLYAGPLPIFNFSDIKIYPEEWEK
jgi:hypothetical protein